jgi:DNA-binding PadR family transcriptional regulator
LLLLAEGDSHGYDLLDQLVSLGFVSEAMDSSILYRDLREMEEMDLIQSTWDEDSKGPRRRVYQINPPGLARLAEMLTSLDQVQNKIQILQDRYQKLRK